MCTCHGTSSFVCHTTIHDAPPAKNNSPQQSPLTSATPTRLENLRFYSPLHRFYPSRGVSFPHDPVINSIVRPTLAGLAEEHEAATAPAAAAGKASKAE